MQFESNLSNKYSRFCIALVISLILPTMFATNCIAASDKAYRKETKTKSHNFDDTSSKSIPILMAASPRVSPAALNLVKKYEGFRSYAYIDTSGLPVIGYGQSKLNGKRVRMGQKVSRAKADAELERELYHIQKIVLANVRVKLNPNQLAALTSLVYNAGTRVVTRSTLARKLNAGNYAGAANEFLRWNKAYKKGKLVAFPGLTRRRQAERQLFLTPYK